MKYTNYRINVAYGDEPAKPTQHTVKARSHQEAERKAFRFLAGRGSLFSVTEETK